ncbi:MAG: ATP-binding protein [Deltaproteobacteria bacterium]|nr:ATP-binding protein [Deltaproteobacteria bacterium]
MGETRVDLLHLLEDLRDAYPGAIEETILTEIVANALDSGATQITFECDPAQGTLTTVDNGSGMRRRELARYHDIAASTKTRGQGIGFAGVGIKLGLLVCEEVVTETRRGKSHVATTWRLASRHRAPWKWAPPLGLVVERGTAVRLKIPNALSPLLDPGFLEASVRRHYQSLFDPTFDELLAAHYPEGITIHVNGRRLEKQRWTAPLQGSLQIRLARRRKPSAFGYLIREDIPLPEEQRGLAISTYGKVIRRGWDWLGLTPSAPERVGGLIEVPELAACLTLNKGDFIRTGARGAAYLAFRKAIQEAVSVHLAAWGDARESTEETRPKFPLLASLVERRSGGQKRLPLGVRRGVTDPQAFVTASVMQNAEEDKNTEEVKKPPGGEPSDGQTGDGQPTHAVAGQDHGLIMPGKGARKPAHYGLDIQFEDRPEDLELGRLVESTVWVNRSHPAYRRALASRSIGYHIALAVAMALAPLAVESPNEHGFVTAFLSRWGEVIDRPASRKRTRR